MGKKVVQFNLILKNARIEAGLSQKQVSDSFGYRSPQYVSNWERGLSTPPVAILKKLSLLYKMKVKMLFDLLLEHKLKETESTLRKDFRL